MKSSLFRRIAPLIAVAMAAPAWAAEWYRYENEDGVVVLSHYIPPSLVFRGYTVVDDRGRVVRVVPRELSSAEIVERDSRAADDMKSADAVQTRRRKDEELLQLYASAADVEAARDRKLGSLEGDIARIRSNFERVKVQKERLEQQGAERERAGHPPSPEILENLKIMDAQLQDREREIELRRREREEQGANFAYDLERIRLLLGETAQAPVERSGTSPVEPPVALPVDSQRLGSSLSPPG